MKYWLIIAILVTVALGAGHYLDIYKKNEQYFTFPKWKETYDLTKGIIESDAHNAYVEILMNNKAVEAYVEIKPLYSLLAHVSLNHSIVTKREKNSLA